MENESSFAGRTVAVFGAAAGWGQKFARTIEPHANVVLRVDPKLKETSCDPGVAMRDAHTILFAVTPDEEINAIAAKHADDLHAGQCILECATTKRKIAETLHWLDDKGLNVCSIHPMARADLPSRGQNMLVMPVGNHGAEAVPQARELARLLEMSPVEAIGFDQHARVMAVVQGMDHLLQRTKIRALKRMLMDLGLPFDVIAQVASANFRINMLGTGRVGIQRTDVSAKIIGEMLASPDTRTMADILQEALDELVATSDGRLVEDLQKDLEGPGGFDPDGSWRAKMLERTNSVLEQMANLDIKGVRIRSSHNRPGTLEEIAGVFRKNGINITATTSHNLEPEDGGPGVTFQFGIDEKSVFDPEQLRRDLAAIGVSIENSLR